MAPHTPLPSSEPLPADPAAALEERRRRAEEAVETERGIADRFARLHAATAALSAAVTPSEVAAVIATRGLATPGAAGCAVGFLSDDGREIQLAALRGAEPPATVRSIPVTGPAPVAVALRERRAIFFADDLPPAEIAAATAACGLPSRGAGALAALPLGAGERILGAIAILFPEPRPFDEEERAFLGAFAHQCGQALDRARLYEGERAARLEAQRAEEAARRAVELQERLVGVVGHDLRTPLAAIRMATGLLFRRGGLSEEQARTLARVGASAARMTSIIRDLLDFTRVRKDGAIPVEMGEIDLSELVRQAVAELKEIHPDREIVLWSPQVVHGRGDPERLAQVVSNLVGNAVQHSPAGARVAVRVRPSADAIHVEVHNDGPEIPAHVLPDIFEPFRQAARDAGPSGSLGLGLFIVRELVRAHGGSVEVRTGAEGTTFTVRLPLPAVASASAELP